METTTKKHSKNTRTRQRKAADYIASGVPIGEAACALGVKYMTVVRWQSSQAFKERLAEHKASEQKRTDILLSRAFNAALEHAHSNPEKAGGAITGVKHLSELFGLNRFFDKNVGKDIPLYGKALPKTGNISSAFRNIISYAGNDSPEIGKELLSDEKGHERFRQLEELYGMDYLKSMVE